MFRFLIAMGIIFSGCGPLIGGTDPLFEHFERLGSSQFRSSEEVPLLISRATYQKNRVYFELPMETAVLVYQIDGTYLGRFGAKGQGPGEFFQISSLQVDQDGMIYVLDQSRRMIQVYDPQFEYVRGIRWETGTGPNRVLLKPGGGLFLLGAGYAGKDYFGVFEIDPQGALVNAFHTVPDTDVLSDWPAAVDQAGTVYVTNCLDNQMNVYAASGKKLKPFALRHPSLTFIESSGKELNELSLLSKSSPLKTESFHQLTDMLVAEDWLVTVFYRKNMEGPWRNTLALYQKQSGKPELVVNTNYELIGYEDGVFYFLEYIREDGETVGLDVHRVRAKF